MSESPNKKRAQWAYCLVMGSMLLGAVGLGKFANQPKFHAQPVSLGDYVVHARSKPCLAKILTFTNQTTEGQINLTDFNKLRHVALGCGGYIEQLPKRQF